MRGLLTFVSIALFCSQIFAGSTPRFLAAHNSGSSDQTSDIQAKVDAAMAVNGIVEFEAGKTYRTKTIYLWKDRSTGTERMVQESKATERC